MQFSIAVCSTMEYNIYMSFFSFSKKNKESYSLVFNIGSGSVSGGIIKFTEKSGVDITYYAKELIPFQQEVSVSKHMDFMKTTVTTLAQRIRTEGLKKIVTKKGSDFIVDRVFYVFASPWSASQVKTIRVKEPKPFKITEAYLSNLIDAEEKKFQVDIAQSGKIIEKKIIQVNLNGYTVTDIYNKIAKELEISVFFTIVPEDILQAVEDSVSKVFTIKNIWCHSSSLAMFSVIRNLFPHKEDFIHLDISEEITDISIIKDGIMTNGATIPLGRNHFIRELSKSLKVTEPIADSMIKMQCGKNNDELATLNISVAMDTAALGWISSISKVLESFREKTYVPQPIFLIANCDLTHFLKNKLEKQDFEVLLVDNKKIKPSTVGEDIAFKLELIFLDNLYKI